MGLIVRCGSVGNDDRWKWKWNWNWNRYGISEIYERMESGLIGERMEDGIYKVEEDGKAETE